MGPERDSPTIMPRELGCPTKPARPSLKAKDRLDPVHFRAEPTWRASNRQGHPQISQYLGHKTVIFGSFRWISTPTSTPALCTRERALCSCSLF
ncbi:hypothetical protein DPMN_114503 [Dreissena polymorpha]|uniref:Uncharacterized protein n=1 Tax=Dreissena polymorpha TaxID=45954 RepID=A0A9D4KK88_DREPO|nr:hypothetical protein DPMN_114503 [Dreissena polymorpha]